MIKWITLMFLIPFMKNLLIFVLSFTTVLGLQAQLSDVLSLSGGPFTPEHNIDFYLNRNIVDTDEIVAGQYYRLIQFDALPNATQLDQLRNTGIELLQYIPNKAYLVAIAQNYQISNLRNYGVRYISKIPDFIKLSEELLSEAYPEYIRRGNQIELLISYPETIDQTLILQYLTKLNITALEYNGYNSTILALAPLTSLTTLYDTPFIFRIEPGPPPSRPDDIGGKTLSRANLLDSHLPSGRHYNGAGISVLCRDDGDVGPHIDFTGRLNQEIENSPLATHADRVSGVMCGSPNLDPDIPGMATEAELYVINYRASFLDNTMDLHFDEKVLVTNSSYSNGCNAGYTNTTRTVDAQCYDNPTLMHVFSSGNSNGESCGYGAGDQWANITGGHKQGKNVIAVGSTTSEGEIANSSSRGPAFDGRIKPDLTAHGQNHTSTSSNNTYRTTSGTSFSAPLVSGVMAMLHQAYQENNNQEIADAALLKTLMLNTANDLGNKGPDFIFGWGSVNAYRAALAIEEKKYELAQISTGATNDHQITIPAGTKETRIMIYWKDPASQAGVSQALINDLDSKLIAPDGTDYFPYVLNSDPDPSLLRRPATTGIDGLNNMEQIAIVDPAAGSYQLEVTGSIIPFGVHDYFITWEHITDDFMITYPAGGEKLQPRDRLRVHWDALPDGEPYSIEYSIDNGSSWTEVPGSTTRLYREFSLPPELTNQARIKVVRGNEEQISQSFTIAEAPQRLNIERVCFDFADINWGKTEGATSYDLFSLGERSMEFLATTTDTFFTVSQESSFDREWYAVSANYNDIKSQRTIAVGTLGEGLEDCKMERDLKVGSLSLTNNGNYILCEGPLIEEITLDIINDGLEPLNNFDVIYQVDGIIIATENIQLTIQPDDTLVHTFQTPYEFSQNTDYEIITWLERSGERLTQNDTLETKVQAYFGNGESLPFDESFSNNENKLPDFWFVTSEEDDITWDIVPAVQTDGTLSEVCVMPFDRFAERGSEDFLNVIPLDLTEATGKLALHFDIAYAHTDRDDGLMIRILGDCGMTVLDTLYEKYGEELDSTFDSFDVPDQAADWMTQVVDISAYAGMEKILIQFVGINQNGSDLFLDNINISEVETSAPVADFQLIANSQTCVLEEIFLANISEGEILSELWGFGFGGIPSASTQNGPHSLSYLFSGEKNITLTVENEIGQNSKVVQLTIFDKPSGGWDAEEIGAAQVQFNSNFDNATFYSWDLGDGNFSNDSDPLHQYAQPGTYEVRLTVRNSCGQRILVGPVEVITSSVEELSEENELGVSIFPNPTDGVFRVLLEEEGDYKLELRNLGGLKAGRIKQTGNSSKEFQVEVAESGVYFLTVKGDSSSETFKVVVVE